MKCLICNRNFTIKGKLRDLFKNNKFYVCDACYKRYPIKLNYNVIPLNNYNLKIYSLFDKYYYFANDPFVLEFSHLLEYVLSQNYQNVLIYNNLNINERKLYIFENLANLVEDDLIIVCDFCQIY